jgi:hypothetical protein
MKHASGERVRCPCCGHRTLPQRGVCCVCPVCMWEDDGQGDADARVVRGGPNRSLSLAAARANYLAFGACDPAHLGSVRRPRPDEAL